MAPVHQDVERAVHRLQVVLRTAVELHRRVHVLGEPIEVARLLEQGALGDVRRVDEVVPRLHVPLARIVLHETADGAALGMEDGEPRTDLVREAVEVELGTQLAVVAPLRLLQLVQVRRQRLLGLPGGAVNTLQLLALLVAAPIGAGDPHQLEVAEACGRGDMGTPAQVDERVGVPIGADHGPLGVDLVDAGLDGADDLLLERLVGEDLESLFEVVLVPDEGLVLLHDRPHFGIDPLEVVVAEMRPPGELEVVVEAVLYDWPDGVLGAGPEAAHRLGHDVRGRVADHLPSRRRVVGDDGDLGAVEQRGVEVHLAAVDRGDHGRLGEPGTDGEGEFGGRRALGQLPLRAVGKPNRYDACHRFTLSCSAGGSLLVRTLLWSHKGTGPPLVSRSTADRSPAGCRLPVAGPRRGSGRSATG
jgi:hypothetical protein